MAVVRAETHLEAMTMFGDVKDKIAESGLADAIEENMRFAIDKISSIISIVERDNALDELSTSQSAMLERYDQFQISYAELLSALLSVHEDGLALASSDALKVLDDSSSNLSKVCAKLSEDATACSDAIASIEAVGELSNLVTSAVSAIDQVSQSVRTMKAASDESVKLAQTLANELAA